MMNQLVSGIVLLACVAVVGMLLMASKKLEVSKSRYFWPLFLIIAGIFAVGFLYLIR